MPKLSEVSGAPSVRLSNVQPSVGVPEMLAAPKMTNEEIYAQGIADAQAIRDQMMRDQYNSLNPIEKIGLGLAKGGEDVVSATKQLGLYLASKTSMFPQLMEKKLRDEQAKAADAERAYQMGTPDGTLAGAGRIFSNTALTAMPGSLATKAMTFEKIASPLLRTAVQGSGGGFAGALFTPTTGDGDFGAEKAKQLGVGTVAGATLSPVIQTMGRLATFNAPSRLMAEEVESAARRSAAPFIAESDDLAVRTGVNFTPGMRTDSRALKIAENAFRQNIVTADKAYEIDSKIIKQTTDYLDKVLAGVSRKPETAETAGAAVQGAVTKAVKNMVDARRATTDPLYRAIDQSGAKIKYDNLAGELQKIADEYAGALDDTSQTIVAHAKRKLAEIAANPEVSASAAARTRSGFSAQTATGDLFKDIDKANNRRLAARLTEAVQRDLESAESVAPLLKDANSLWRKHTARIKQAENTILGKVVGKDLANEIDDFTINQVAPEKVFDKLKNLKPSEARFVKSFLDKHNPEAATKMKRAMLQDAYDSMFSTSMSAGADGRPQLGKFVDFVNKNKALGKWYTDEEMKAINDGVQVIKRVGDKFGYNTSFTAGQTFFNELLTSPFKGAKDIVSAVTNAKSMEKALNAGTYLPKMPQNKGQIAPVIGAAIGQAGAQEMQGESR